MNDYKDKYGYSNRRKIEVPQREFTIRGHKVSDIKREKILKISVKQELFHLNGW